MDIEAIKDEVEKSYGFNIKSINKIKNVYKIINENDKDYCLKVIRYEFKHFYFIFSAMKYLMEKELDSMVPFLKTLNGMEYIKLDSKYGYLTEWIDARQANYDNMVDIMLAVEAMSKLHLTSKGFIDTEEMKPRIGWGRWIKTFNTRIDEIYDFKDRILKKNIKSEFDQLYFQFLEEEADRGRRAVSKLINSEYFSLMNEEKKFSGFCHHDFAHHNVMIQPGNKIKLIDFDYCILDTHLHDLSSIIIRTMKNGKWDLEKAEFILSVYNESFKINESEIPVMSGFIAFPQDFWQVGIQYYWEKQNWGEEFFMTKLKKIIDDREEREEFVEEFEKLKVRW
ncbi:CotS family spore coat protein [Clostridium bornimense]|uniref:CotS family spore coat protein n=1 Tax=Clostridium bornimense TaxID=1216932 RepID=W6RYD7_9CLOT|nr:CotS family spore coat protein [Clostridium bornimense]CDM69458.1 CotS family spore coat protein [Clostridium bornimense]